MIPIKDLLIFASAALLMVLSPGPNMIYLISRSITQGRKAGFISLIGVVCGFLFHIVMVAFGLTVVFMAVPFAYQAIKFMGAAYLLYMAWQAVKPGSSSPFDTKNLPEDSPFKLFQMGLLTNVLNPKAAMFYLSFFPQFLRPEYGNILSQTLLLGITQISVSFSVNLLIVLTASQVSSWFSANPKWIRVQKWFMASVLTGLAVKMALSKK